MTRSWGSCSTFAFVLSLVLWLPACDSNTGRRVYSGGPILTMDAGGRIAEALGIEGEHIAAVGSLAEVEAWAGPDADHLDLAGRALLPGFIDAHGHFPGAGMYSLMVDLNSPPIGDIRTIDALVSRVRAAASERSAGDWVIGSGYDDTLLEESRHPTREDLDRASSEHPIIVWHVSLHLAAANSLALQRLGIDADTPDPEGGLIQRDPQSGEPNGVLEENAVELVRGALPTPSLLDGLRIMRSATELYLSAGVTTAQSGLSEPSIMQALHWASRLGQLPLRIVLWPSRSAADDLLSGDFEFRSYDERWVRRGAVKLLADGSIQGYTGYLSRPYHVPPGDDANYRGYPRIEREALADLVRRYHSAGLQIAVHGNGDASIDDILDAFEQAQKRHPRDDARHIIIHAQMARSDQLDRMAALGVIPSFFSLHTYYWGDRHRDIFMGPERAAKMSPARSAEQRGIPFTIHADSPVVPMEPLRLVWSAVNRISAGGTPIGPAERITPEAALRAITINAARQHFEDEEKGSLEVGKLADLVILSESPLAVPEKIDQIRVLETIIGGRSVYRANDSQQRP